MSAKIEHRHRDLIELCKTGDRKAQFDLYDLYAHAMYNTSLRMMGNEADAEDVVQEAFIKAFGALKRFEYKSTFGAWLKRIVINQAMDTLKKKSWEPQESNYALVDEPEDGAMEWKVESIMKGIEKLADGYRQILCLYLLEGYDHEEISQIAGVTVSTSKSQYHRAKKKLLEIIKEESWEI